MDFIGIHRRLCDEAKRTLRKKVLFRGTLVAFSIAVLLLLTNIPSKFRELWYPEGTPNEFIRWLLFISVFYFLQGFLGILSDLIADWELQKEHPGAVRHAGEGYALTDNIRRLAYFFIFMMILSILLLFRYIYVFYRIWSYKHFGV